MEEVQTATKFGAFDLLLLGVFFISYNVLGLMQVAFLYGRRWILFGAVTIGVIALAQGLRYLDVSGFCADRSSAIVCGEDKQELVALGMIWGIVCIGILVIFILLQGLKRMRAGRS